MLVAPPGSGKTTRVPPAVLRSGLLSAEYPAVSVLQPRRVAARASAARIAEEQRWTLGEEVGFQVRFERRLSRQTPLRFLTEGVLTRQLLADPYLENVGAVILDEFHERNLNSDMALALLRQVRETVRPDLILIVMSATLDAEQVSRYLNNCPILQVDGGLHEVAVHYQSVNRPADPEEVVPLIEERLSDKSDSGHILVFLPGFAEIRRLANRLALPAAHHGAVVLPLHGSLPAEDQDRVLRPSVRRKVILSTNVAETSLTIDGVTAVIDSGLARTVHYDGARGLDRWETVRISRASADQARAEPAEPGPAGAFGSGPSASTLPAPSSSSPKSTASTSRAQSSPCTPGAFATPSGSIGLKLPNPKDSPRPSACSAFWADSLANHQELRPWANPCWPYPCIPGWRA